MIEEEQKKLDKALYEAVKKGKRSLLKELIQTGADVNKADNDGLTPLHRAILNGNKECMQLLIKSGADVDKGARLCNITPLHWAALGGHKECAKFLIEVGADVNNATTRGKTPLAGAVFWGHKECVELLIKERADVNKADDSGRTPLHVATSKGKIECVKLLIKAGADVGEIDKYKIGLLCDYELYYKCIKLLHIAKIADFIIDDKVFSNPRNIEIGHEELEFIAKRFGKLLQKKLDSANTEAESVMIMLEMQEFMLSNEAPKELVDRIKKECKFSYIEINSFLGKVVDEFVSVPFSSLYEFYKIQESFVNIKNLIKFYQEHGYLGELYGSDNNVNNEQELAINTIEEAISLLLGQNISEFLNRNEKEQDIKIESFNKEDEQKVLRQIEINIFSMSLRVLNDVIKGLSKQKLTSEEWQAVNLNLDQLSKFILPKNISDNINELQMNISSVIGSQDDGAIHLSGNEHEADYAVKLFDQQADAASALGDSEYFESEV